MSRRKKEDRKFARKVLLKRVGYPYDSSLDMEYLRNRYEDLGVPEKDRDYSCQPFCGYLKGIRLSNPKSPKRVYGLCYEKEDLGIKGVNRPMGLCISKFPMDSKNCPVIISKNLELKKNRKFYVDSYSSSRGFLTGRVPWRVKNGEIEMVVLNLYLDKETRGLIRDIYVEGSLVNQSEERGQIMQEIEPLKKKDHKSFRRYIAGLEEMFSNEISGPELPEIIVNSMIESGEVVYGNRPFGISDVYGDKKSFGKRLRLKESEKTYTRSVA